LTASYGYVGGHEGKSIYNWYIHEVCTLIEVPQNMLNLFYKCNGSITKGWKTGVLCPTTNKYKNASFLPMKIVLQIENLRSKCLLNFQVEGDFGSPISEVSGLLQYRITKEAIGKFISFQCTPVRDDGIVGDKRICMGQERIRPGNTFMWGTFE
jgi:hypothetical protein